MILRRLAMFATALIVSVACYISLGSAVQKNTPAVSPVNASYCTYSTVEANHFAAISFYSPYLGKTDYLNEELVTRDGDYFSGVGCGQYKQYELIQWTSYGTPGSYYSNIRAWICGTYLGSWATYSYYEYSPELHYSSCGRQADNYNSYFYDTYTELFHSVYVNQG